MTETVYAADSAVPPPPVAAGPPPERADVVVVGGGFTGLSAAMHLARSGRGVVVLEAGDLADGASGRNGGQLHWGHRRDQVWLASHVGEDIADALWELGTEAVANVHRLFAEFGDDCGYRPGLIEAAHTPRAFDEERHYADALAARHGMAFEILDRPAMEAAIGSRRYPGGVRDTVGGHLDPLAFARHLGHAAVRAGAVLTERTKAVALARADGRWRVTAETGGGRHTISAGAVLLAGNGMMRGLEKRVEARVLPLVNHIVATAPLPSPLIPGGEAVSDTRFVVRYFRQDRAGRLIFGGGESFRRHPRDVAAFVRPYLGEIYPALRDAPLTAAWSGTLGITLKRMPIVRRLDPGLYVAAGYSGQGVGLAAFAGSVIARAIDGDTARLDVFARLPAAPFPGGRLFQTPIAHLAMAWFSLRDRLPLPL
jgi:gamma-glutamylputrescine oxidase